MEHQLKLGKQVEHQKEDDELLIFGYSCKLFRDDEKAMYVENGEHLIPWMGDTKLMIDRFDVRGTLYDLSGAESKVFPIEETMTEAELKTEQLCEQERYFALYHDELQYQSACEEETKRLQVELNKDDAAYNQISFNYAKSTEIHENQNEESQVGSESVNYNPSQDDDVFIPSDELNIPYGIEVPETVKQNKIIIKTAKFVVSQGAQMEIIIKTKQAGNPMFGFLSFDNSLNAYYKHIVVLVRHGKLKLEEKPNNSEADNDQYLHPNLSQSVRPDLTPGDLSSPARPSPNCPYSKLTVKIKESQKVPAIEESDPPTSSICSVDSPQSGCVKSQPVSEGFMRLVDYPSFSHTAGDSTDEEDAGHVDVVKPKEKTVHDYSNIPWPPPEMQMVIDKMASYIIKNGAGFEEIVKSRKDPRMGFLESSHKYNAYYRCKIELYNEVYGDIFKDPAKLQDWSKKHHQKSCANSNSDHSKTNGTRTISFSIKSREQEAAVTMHTTFPIESSTSEEDEDIDEVEKEKRRIAREKRRAERKKKEEKEKKEREEFLRKERSRREEEERRKMSKKNEGDSSGNEDLYDIFKYAQEMDKDEKKEKTLKLKPVLIDESSSIQEQRKKRAAQFLSKLKGPNDETPVYGPQLPPELVMEYSNDLPDSPSSCSSSSSVQGTNPTLPSTPRKPSPLSSSKSTIGLCEALSDLNEIEIAKSPKLYGAGDPKLTDKSAGDSNSLTEVLYSCLAKPQNRDSVDKESHSHRRARKKHSRRRSETESPISRKSRKKRKKTYNDHKRKKRRSRSRSPSRHRSKSHRSSHKKKTGKHSSRRDKERSRKKRKRRRSSSSVSSLPSSESSEPSSLPTESESDMDVQVIESEDAKRSTRESSIVSLPSVASYKNPSSKSLSTKDPTPDIEDKSSFIVKDNSQSLLAIPLHLSSRQIFSPTEVSNSSDGPNDSEKKPLFDPGASSAMAKIAQGLRVKLNAMLEKESKIQ